MSNHGPIIVASAGAAAAYAQNINASRAYGAVVVVDSFEFQKILDRFEDIPLVVHATCGWFNINYQYLTNYKGIFFYTKSSDELAFRRSIELVQAAKIWIPFN
ncbi:hypothetical protein FACS1894170_01310 [Planctomycetales bacterium]|nr:hypothetical protein FACS1894170_01310 [Planctomycetales bacterium]